VSSFRKLLHRATFLPGGGPQALDRAAIATVLVEQSLSDFGDADAILLLDRQGAKSAVFLEAKVKTAQAAAWRLQDEFAQFQAGLKSTLNSSNLFTQLYHKVRFVEAARSGDGRALVSGVAFPSCSTKKRRRIGDNPVVLQAVKEITPYLGDVSYVAIVPDVRNEVERFRRDVLDPFRPPGLDRWDTTRWGFLCWSEVRSFCESEGLRRTVEVLDFNRVQIGGWLLIWPLGLRHASGPDSAGQRIARAWSRPRSRGETPRWGQADLDGAVCAYRGRGSMKLYQLAYVGPLYAAFGGFDRALKEFLAETHGALDPRTDGHQEALFRWLREWGCRQFDKKHERMAAQSLREWTDEHPDMLLPLDSPLLKLETRDLDRVAEAYEALEPRRAGQRERRGRVQDVTFGPTGASKVLFALRPDAFPPWDDAIRRRIGSSYREFLDRTRGQLQELVDDAKCLGIDASEIPRQVGRPDSSLAKLADEYNWVTITKKVELPTPESCGIGLLRRPVSECGRLRQGAGGHPGGDRRRSVLMLTTLLCPRSQRVLIP
jgi:hypothetical protein